MVVALREQPPKKSKLSLFRLAKSSLKSSNPSQPSPPHSATSSIAARDPRTDAAHTYSSYSTSAQDSTPRQPHPNPTTSKSQIVSSARHAARERREGAPPITSVHYQYPESTNLPANYHSSSTFPASQHPPAHSPSDDHHEQQYRRTRADSLPLQGFVHPSEAVLSSDPPERRNMPHLERIQIEFATSSNHSRRRSHFSIPDVIVTTCEEEGEQELVELQIPPNKRRSYLLRDAAEHLLHHHGSSKKSSSGFVHRPAPLIRFDTEEIKAIGLPRTGSIPSISSSPTSPTATSPSTPSSSASSSLSKGSTAKWSRKASFPLLFGRKSFDSSRSRVVDQTFVEDPLSFPPTTPASAPPLGAHYFDPLQPDGLIFASHDSAPTAAPSRSIFTRAANAISSPPITPTSPPPSLNKKQIKAKAKEELALIKELERVDRLVKQHDVKARKAQQKAEAKERKRAAKLAQINHDFFQQQTRPSLDTNSSVQSQIMPASRSSRKTIFQAATKASASAGPARRTSIRALPDPRSFVGERRGSGPVLSKFSDPIESRACAAAPFGIDLPGTETHAFTEPRAAPQPIIPIASSHQPPRQTVPVSPPKATHSRPRLSMDTSPPRPMRSAPPQPELSTAPQTRSNDSQPDLQVGPEVVDGETSFGEDPYEAQGWNRQSWSELNSGFTGPLPSLIHTSSSSNSVANTGAERDTEEVDQAIELEEKRNALMARRASVQRVLALSDAEGSILQKRASLHKRGSQQYLKRRSSRIDSIDMPAHSETNGYSSKRSSVTSDGRRRSFIRHMGDDEGWRVIDGDETSTPDDSVTAQPDLSAPKWDDWVKEEDERPPSSQEMAVEMDLVLADLRAAQHADHVRNQANHAKEGSGERTPTQETVKDPFSTRKLVGPSPPRPDRSKHRTEPASPTQQSAHSSSISSTDSFTSNSSGTGTTVTIADVQTGNTTEEDAPCFSRPCSPQHQDRSSLEDKENHDLNPNSGAQNDMKQSKSEFRLSLALTPLQLQPLELFGGVEGTL